MADKIRRKRQIVKTLSKLLIILPIALSEASYSRDPEWFSQRMKQLDAAIKIRNSDERIEALSKFLSIGNSGRMDEEQEAIFKKSQAALLQIPGHATYFQNKLGLLRAKTIELSKFPNESRKANAACGDYEDFRNKTFPILGLLPSSETVSVLGQFLNEPEGRDGKDLLGQVLTYGDYAPHPITAGAAAIAIRNLGIEHPPFRQPTGTSEFNYTSEEIDAWKDWWNEVKDGKRTYRFIGSSIEYGPDGPATKEQLQRIERNRQREASSKDPRSAVSSNEADDPPHAKTGVAIGGAALLLLASMVYVLRAKKRSPR